VTMSSPAEAITALFGGMVTLNIHLLIPNLTSVPQTLDCVSLGRTYGSALPSAYVVYLARNGQVLRNHTMSKK
ncbi:hypothetical protein ASPBRDRAFT_123368, partial [Aspergillus brasiliensis CBS 101740]